MAAGIVAQATGQTLNAKTISAFKAERGDGAVSRGQSQGEEAERGTAEKDRTGSRSRSMGEATIALSWHAGVPYVVLREAAAS